MVTKSFITLQFASRRSLGSWLIGYGTHGWAAHVDAVLPDGSLLGSMPWGGVKIRPATHTKWRQTMVVRLPTSKKKADEFYAWLHEQIGRSYDFVGITSFVFGRDWRSDHRWFCSELIAAGLERCGYFDYRLANTSNKITPMDLLLACSVKTNIYAQHLAQFPNQTPGQMKALSWFKKS